MSDETEICELKECKNPVRGVVTDEVKNRQKHVCHECVIPAMLIMGAEE